MADSPAILAPGGAVPVPDFLDYGTLLSTKISDFGDASGSTGVLTEYVFDDSGANPFGGGEVDFAFSLSLSHGDVVSVALPGYAGFKTAVKSCNDSACLEGAGDPPNTAARSPNGDLVTFSFATPLTGKSAGFVIYTDARFFVDPDAIITDSAGDETSVSVFAPAASAPEPAAWALLVAGVGALGVALRRRRVTAFAAGRVRSLGVIDTQVEGNRGPLRLRIERVIRTIVGLVVLLWKKPPARSPSMPRRARGS